MKVNNLFVAGMTILGLSMSACNNNNDDFPGSDENLIGGTTFAGMYISMQGNAKTKGVTDSQDNYKGRDPENKLNTLDLLSNKASMNWNYATTETPGSFWETPAGSGIFKVAPWKTNPGNHHMALVFNNDAALKINIGEGSSRVYGTAETAMDDIEKLSSDGKFVMTSDILEKTVQPNKDETTVKAGTTETDNVFTFDVERVVSQGLVVKSDGLQAATKDGKGEINLTTLQYAAINGAVETYLFRNNAGERTITEADGLYKGFKSAIDDYTDFENAEDPGSVKDKLIRLGNLASAAEHKTNDDLGNYKAIDVAENTSTAQAARGIYFLENSVDKTKLTTENKNFGFYRLAYAKVYATYTPKEVWNLVPKTRFPGTQIKELKAEAGVEGATFYMGETDGLFYASKEAAEASKIAPKQKSFTYTNGRCAYRALWNRQVNAIDGTVVNADVRRNNTYLLTIKEFAGLGMPWDPSDPNDPNLPKPADDPTTKPENPDVEKEASYMRVDAKVLQWNLVSREVVLE